ncbi:urease accessory protein UreF [Nonomuraea zeae]|uniref:Urease accessory protein UreF n=1 Tax=Nonomuraea zeae TaxID=1642303 RepID=A0A5S4G497_9ACTN|nr:urease accessory UreF family protein [Nonomuraea zeae]TMR27344.1 urease accessory protein UreF [Nonomuraea zeae]
MNAALLLLSDSRLPAGGHAHSGGAEQAVASGAVHDVPSLAGFLHGRLRTAGAVTAALTAAACAASARPGVAWGPLDAEVDARTAAPAQRTASRTQGRLLVRVACRIWPSAVLGELARTVPDPHHPIALGAAAHAAGATPEEAAMAAAYQAVSGPATAVVRLLGLDPVAVHALLARLTPELTAVAAEAGRAAANCLPDPGLPDAWAALPAYSAPALDLLAQRHARAEVRLFVS